jgi:hypothetical protein
MDSLSRLINWLRAFVVLAFVLTVAPAFAEGVVPATGPASCTGMSDPDPDQPPLAAYTAEGWSWVRAMRVHPADGLCAWGFEYTNAAYSWANPYWLETNIVSPAPTCPADSTSVAGQCVCSAGFIVNQAGTGCAAPPNHCSESIGQSMPGEVSAPVTGKGVVPSALCGEGCQYLPTGGAAAGAGVWGGKNGKWWYSGNGSDWKVSGVTCSSSPDQPAGPLNPPKPLPDPPPKGMCPGSVNGVSVVVPCDETGTSSGSGTPSPGTGGGGGGTGGGSGGTGTTPGPGGSNTGAPVTTPSPSGAAPGSSTNTTQTGCNQSTCTTTTTTTNKPDGTTTTQTGSTTTDKGTYCKDNPGSPNCADKQSSFTGACAATACNGDAVQCAIAREQYRRNCELFDATEASARGPAAATAGDQPGDHPGAHKSSVALGTFDQTNILAGGCPADMSVPVSHFGSVTLPFSKLCGPADVLGNVLVAITALACIGIVFVRGS